MHSSCNLLKRTKRLAETENDCKSKYCKLCDKEFCNAYNYNRHKSSKAHTRTDTKLSTADDVSKIVMHSRKYRRRLDEIGLLKVRVNQLEIQLALATTEINASNKKYQDEVDVNEQLQRKCTILLKQNNFSLRKCSTIEVRRTSKHSKLSTRVQNKMRNGDFVN